MAASPPSDVRYICKCGQTCTVDRVHCWIYVTCKNPKCKENGIRQLATWGKHSINQEDLKHV